MGTGTIKLFNGPHRKTLSRPIKRLSETLKSCAVRVVEVYILDDMCVMVNVCADVYESVCLWFVIDDIWA